MGHQAGLEVDKPHRLGCSAVLHQLGENRAAHASGRSRLFYHQELSAAREGLPHGIEAQRRNGIELDEIHGNLLVPQPLGGGQYIVDGDAIGDNGHSRLLAPLIFPHCAVVRAVPAPGIAHRHGAACLQNGRPEHPAKLRLTGRAKHRHARDLAQIPHVKDAVVGFAVLPHQPGAIHCQHHVKPQNPHVLLEHVVAALQKSGIRGKDRQQTLLGKPRRHGNGMPFGNAHIEISIMEAGGKLG